MRATLTAALVAMATVIVPRVDYQDAGMLRAYGLVYDLLRAGIPIRWIIRDGKGYGEEDFTVASTDFATGTPIAPHGYRGGPFVIDAPDAADAEPIIDAWLMANPEVVVHEVADDFEADVSRYLVVAPTIAMVADGNENIARGYMLAAGIPDSVLDLDWPDESPDMLDIEELSGPTEDSHVDGALFDEDGDPVYCQLMSMHWGVGDAEDNPEVVAEVRAFLNNPTHFFAECQAVNAFENLEPHGFFLTPNGFEFGDQPDAVDFFNADSPFGQLDGAFDTVGGSEPSYTLPPGDMYKAGDIVMLTAAGTPEGTEDVWMTGFLDGQCPPEEHECGKYGKISYLGGHQYSTDMPVSEHLDAQGTRLFLNSLFEAPCATVEGLPNLAVAVDAPAQTTEPDVTLKITYVNTSFATALSATLVDTLPEGASFVSASDGGTFDAGTVTWDLGNLGPGESGDLEIEVTLDAFGIYENSAALQYSVGLTPLSLTSNLSQTEYGDMFPGGTTGGDDDDDATDGAADDTGGSGGGEGSDGSNTTGIAGSTGSDPTGAGTDTPDTAGADRGTDDSGCSCRSQGSAPSSMLLLGLFALLRRRASLAATATLLAGCGNPDQASPGDGGETDGISMDTGITTVADDGLDTGEKLDLGEKTDILQQPDPTEGCQAIDFLFIIDSSESMKDHQENLIASFPGFAAEIQSSVPADDWHVMVVDTDAQWGGVECANACSTLGQCPDEPAFDCSTPPPELCDITIGSGEIAPFGEGASNAECLETGARYVPEGTADLESVFSCVAQVGVDGNSEERTAEAMVRGLSEDLVGDDGCNAGFLRDDAILVVTIITDEPDINSPDDAPAWVQAIVDAKNGDDQAIVVMGLLPDADADALCEEAVEAPRLVDFVTSFPNSARASVCEPDYSPFFAAAVDVIVETCDDFVPPPPEG